MDERKDGRMNGRRADGRKDGRTKGWTEGRRTDGRKDLAAPHDRMPAEGAVHHDPVNLFEVASR
jgi:hypothetical protein